MQATKIKDESPEAVVGCMMKINGPVVVNITKATDEEKALLKEAADLLPDGKEVKFVDQKVEENLILQQIVEQLCDGHSDLFCNFLEALWAEGSDHFVKEWNEFVVGHPVAGKAESVEDTHHWANLGLEDANHPLREKVTTLIVEGAVDFHETLATITAGLKPHPNFKDERDILFAILMAELSNFVRGGVFYNFSNPEKVQGYFPRQVAVRTLLQYNE